MLLFAVVVIALAGCASTTFPSDADARPATGVPEQFGPPGLADREASAACWNPMTDPRDGTAIRMARSSAGRGDYEVPPGRYGVREGELLRLDCTSGRVIGIVRR